jgi:hypothetical protein
MSIEQPQFHNESVYEWGDAPDVKRMDDQDNKLTQALKSTSQHFGNIALYANRTLGRHELEPGKTNPPVQKRDHPAHLKTDGTL